jgi:DmsE family decaheme c-type cytochrome
MKIRKAMGSALLALAALAGHGAAVAQADAAAAAASAPAPTASAPEAPYVPGTGTELSEKGADSCLECHDDESDAIGFSTAAIFKTPHGSRANARSPFAKGGLQCEACHGPGARHSDKSAKALLTTNSQKANSFLGAPERNAPCLTCHQSDKRNAWHVGAHDSNRLACTDCHRLHTERDAVQVKSMQADVCYRCHKQERLEFQKASTHPVRYGLMTCSDCHNAHGSTSTAMLQKPTLNQTCFTCHAEKRGPLLWEHAPVAEDCSLCHTPHGSVRQALLNKSGPLLCQQCHSPAGHPSVARTGASLPGGSAGGSVFVVAGSCMNCHSQVHGSNHPAGAKLMR